MASTVSLLGARHLWEVVENKPARSLAVSLREALNGIFPKRKKIQVSAFAVNTNFQKRNGNSKFQLLFYVFLPLKEQETESCSFTVD